MTLTRTIDQWRNMKPDAVVAVNAEFATFCIRDAQADILALHAEVERLRKIEEAARVQYEAYSAWSGLADALRGEKR